MDGIALRNWPKGLGCALALLLLLSLLSFDLQDPTLTNLRMPSTGIANWLSLPGALLGGTLLELLGTAALAAPLLWLNYVLCARNRPPLYRYAAWCTALLLAAAGLHGLVAEVGDPSLVGPGLAGWAVRHWAQATIGPWPAAALLAYVAAFATVRIVYAPLVHTGLRDARLFTGLLLREGWRGWYAGWRAVRLRAARMQRVAGSTALGLTRGTGLGVSALVAGVLALLLAPPRLVLRWLGELRSPSLARIKSRSGGDPADAVTGRGAEPPWADAEDAAVAAATTDDADAFARWFERTPEPVTPARPDRPALARLLGTAAKDDDEIPGTPVPDRVRAPVADTETPAVVTADTEAPSDPKPLDARADGALAKDGGALTYEFEQPEAEAAWRERFQRYARNLDLDWEEQLWRRKEEEAGEEGEAGGDAEP